MPNIRFKDLPTTASSTASDDFLGVDGATNGTRKLNAFSPSFGGNATVGGNLTVGNGSAAIVQFLNRGTTSQSNLIKWQTAGADNWSIGSGATSTNTNLEFYNHNTASSNLTLNQSTGAVTLAGNLTVIGAGNSSVAGNLLFNTSTARGILTINKTANDTLSTANAAAFIGQPDNLEAGLLMQQTASSPYSFVLQARSPSGIYQFPISLNPQGGNVLIGKTTPDGGQKLQVAGTADITGATTVGGNLTVSGAGTSTIAGNTGIGGTPLNLGTWNRALSVVSSGNPVVELVGGLGVDGTLAGLEAVQTTGGNVRMGGVFFDRAGANNTSNVLIATTNAGTMGIAATFTAAKNMTLAGNLTASGTGNNIFNVSGGNVGIGAASPSGKLTVYGGQIEWGANPSLGFLGYTGGNPIVGAIGALSLLLYTNGAERARITSGGNLLIGKTTPDGGQKLQVAGTADITGATTVGGNLTVSGGTSTINGGAGAINMLVLGGNATSDAARVRMLVPSTKYNWQIGAQQNVDNGFEITPSTAVGGTTFSSPAIQIAATTGNTSINYALTVGGNATVGGYISTTTNAGTNGVGASFLAGNATLNGFTAYASGASADQKYWTWQSGSAIGDGVFRLRALNDALSNGINAITVTRSGISSVAVTLGGNLTVSGASFLIGGSSASASTPQIAWSFSSQTGIFFPGGTVIGFTQGAVESARFSSGNLLIGKSTPDGGQKLQVAGTADITGATTVGGNLTVSGTLNTASINGSVTLGSSGPVLSSSLAARAAAQGVNFTDSSDADGVGVSGLSAFGQGTVGSSAGDFTFAGRATLAAASTQYSLSSGSGGNGFLLLVQTGGTLISSQPAVGSNSPSTGTVPIGRPFWFAYVRSGQTGTYYIDGVAAGTTSDSKNYSAAVSKLGARDGGDSLVGSLAPVVLNTALTAAEVKSLWESAGALPGWAYSNAGTTLNTASFANSGALPYTSLTGASATGFTAVIASGTAYAVSDPTFAVQIGNRYRVSGTLTLNNGKVVLPFVRLVTPGLTVLSPVTNIPSSGAFSVDVECAVASSGATLAFASTGDADYSVSGVLVTPLGALLAPDPTYPGSGTTWPSSAGVAGIIPGIGSNGTSWAIPSSSTLSGNWTVGGNLTVSGGTVGTAASTNLTLAGGSSGASLVLAQGANGGATITGKGAGGILLTNPVAAVTTIERTGLNAAGAAGILSVQSDAKTANDTLRLSFFAKDSANNAQLYGVLETEITDPTSTSEDSNLAFYSARAGSLTKQATLTNLGNLLIGTAIDGGQKLQVKGGVKVIDSGNDSNYITIGSGNDAPAGGNSFIAQTGTLVVGTAAAASLLLRTGGTTALTLDSSQNATFAGMVTAEGGVLSTNQTGNTARLALQRSDTSWIVANETDFRLYAKTGRSSDPSGGTNYFQITNAGNATFAGSVTVGGNLIVNGTTTTVNSTVSTIKDPIITLGGANAGTAATSDDNKDRGIEFKWHDGTAAKTGFFGFDDSTGYFTFIPDATNTSEVFSGTQGDIQATNFRGNLIGNITGNTTISGNATVGGTLAVSGAGTSTFLGPVSASSTSSVTLLDLITTGASASNGGSFARVGARDGAGLSSGDRLGGYLFNGSTGATTDENSVAIFAYANEAWSAGVAGAKLDIDIAPNGSVTRQNVLRATTASVTITPPLTVSGNATVGGNLNVQGNVTASGTSHVFGPASNTVSYIQLTRNGAVTGGLSSANAQLTLFGGATPAEHVNLFASGGLYVGVTPSDPGANNLRVQGNLTVSGGTVNFGADVSLLRSSAGVLRLQSTSNYSHEVTNSAGTGAATTSYNNTGGALFIGVDNISGGALGTSTPYAGVITRLGAYPLIFRTNSITALTLDSSQNATFAGKVTVSGTTGSSFGPISRTNGTNVTGLTLSDSLTGASTVGFGLQIRGTSNNGNVVSAIGFENGGTGTNNESQFSVYTQNVAGALTRQLLIGSTGNATLSGNLTVSGTGNNIFNASGGNLLVGKSTPDGGQKLQVAGTANITGATTVGGTLTVGATTVGGTLTVQSNGPNTTHQAGTATAALWNRWLNSAGTRRGYYGYGSGGDSTFTIMNEEAASFVLGTNNATVLTLNSTGNATFAGNVNVDGGINFLRGSGEYSTYIKANDYVDGGYNGSSVRYWIELGSKGGTHIVLNTDGSAAASENAFDHFTIWQYTNGSGAIAAGARKFWITNIGRVNFANSIWHNSSDGVGRFYYGTNGSTFYKGGGSGAIHTFRNASDADILTLNNSKDATFSGNLTVSGAGGSAVAGTLLVGATSGANGSGALTLAGNSNFDMKWYNTGARAWSFEGGQSGNDHTTTFSNAGVGKHNVVATGNLTVNGDIAYRGVKQSNTTDYENIKYFTIQKHLENDNFNCFPTYGGTVPTFTTDNNTSTSYSKVALFPSYFEAEGSDYIPVQPGEKLYGEIWAKRLSGASGTAGVIFVGITRYDKDKRVIAGNLALDYFVATGFTVPTDGVWYKYSGTTTLPTSHTPFNGGSGNSDGGPVRYIRAYLIVNYSSGTIPTYLTGFTIRKVDVIKDSGVLNFNGNVGIGTSTPGAKFTVGTNFANTSGITVDNGGNSNSQLILRKAAAKTAYSVLCWDSNVYIGAGIYYENGSWVHHNSNNNNQLFAFSPGVGVNWFASSNGAGSWNIVNNQTLWNDTGTWKSLVQSTAAGISYFTGGNVGIGTTSPTTLLNVQGSLATRNFKTFTWSSLSASAAQARRYEIARLGHDTVNWDSTGVFEVEIFSQYYMRPVKKRYMVSYGYPGAGDVKLVEYQNSGGDNNFKVTLGTEVVTSGNIKYLPVYIDVKYYCIADVSVRTNWNHTTINSSPGAGLAYINESPSPSNISDFTADSTIEIASGGLTLAGNLTVSGTGNNIFNVGGGSVGIGASSPSANLQVNRSSQQTDIDNASQVLALLNTSTDTANNRTGIRFRQENGTNTAQGFIGLSSTGNGATRAALVFASPNTSGNAIERARFTSSGNLLVGTTTDGGQKLQVGGDFKATGYIWAKTGNAYLISSNGINAEAGFDVIGNDAYIFAASGKTLSFYTNATQKVSINTSGNVGIGTSTPYDKLEVAGGIAATGYTTGSASQAHATIIGVNGGNSYLQAVDWGVEYKPLVVEGKTINLGTGTGSVTSRFYIDNSGNVGIGAISPQKRLDVNGTGIIASFGGSFGVGSFGGFHFGYSESALGNGNDFYKKSALVFERTDNHNHGNNASGKIHFLLNNVSNQSATSLSHSVVTIDSDANGNAGSVRMGIGTTSPASKLHVYGGMTTLRAASSGQYDLIRLEDNAGSACGAIGVNTSGSMYLSNTTGGTQHFVLTTGGNVGIGATGPSTKLQVVGSVAFGNSSSNAPGTHAAAFGENSFASGNNSFAAGYFSTASNFHCFAVGFASVASGHTGIALGYYATAGSNGNSPIAIGRFVTADGECLVFGRGVDVSNRLVNSTANSIMMGVNSNLPTLYIGGASGVGTTGNVGIGLVGTTPSSKLEVNGVVKDQYGDLRTLPQNAKSAAYTLAAADTGRLITITTGGITVPSGTLSTGQVVTIYNDSASNQTITQGASVTMYLAGTATTGNRTLAQRGVATVICVASNTFVISGSGLT